MKIEHDSVVAFEFDGITIRDYTAGMDTSSSLARITVPAGARHKRALSRRSDKVYYAIDGRLDLTVGNRAVELTPGDACIIEKDTKFSYENTSGSTARLLLIHTPAFRLEDEVFDE